MGLAAWHNTLVEVNLQPLSMEQSMRSLSLQHLAVPNVREQPGSLTGVSDRKTVAWVGR